MGNAFSSEDVGNVKPTVELRGLVVSRPEFHVMPESGWMNDPNGPIFYDGKYHLFYQHLPGTSVWDYGIVWGHASSADLVDWQHHPIALQPATGTADADGCFSGCCAVNEDGIPTILYTGVCKRDNPDCGVLPPKGHDLGLEFIETQCAAMAVSGGGGLVSWEKSDLPAIPFPPKNLPLTGWRDPFILDWRSACDEWIMLIGSGLKGKGGAVMVYKSMDLTSGWYFDGFLCSGSQDTGCVWECPILVKLDPPPAKTLPAALKPSMRKSVSVASALSHGAWETPWEYIKSPKSTKMGRSQSMDLHEDTLNNGLHILSAIEEGGMPTDQYLFCVSPDAKENAVVYWLGDYQQGRFLIEEAKGPFCLDMGNVLYAPNTMQDAEGRQILWGWLRDLEMDEAPRRGVLEYSGCLSVPRVLSIKNRRLAQVPADEIKCLRKDSCWILRDGDIDPRNPVILEDVVGQALDIEVTFERGGSRAAGLLLFPFKQGGERAAIVFDWETAHLEVIVDPVGVRPGAMGSRATGGFIENRDDANRLELRILMDFSCIEIFTSTGQVLSTRVYRGESRPDVPPMIEFFAQGGVAKLPNVAAYEMKSVWGGVDEEDSKVNVGHPKAMHMHPFGIFGNFVNPTSFSI